jgi:hypothetical protein
MRSFSLDDCERFRGGTTLAPAANPGGVGEPEQLGNLLRCGFEPVRQHIIGARDRCAAKHSTAPINPDHVPFP